MVPTAAQLQRLDMTAAVVAVELVQRLKLREAQLAVSASVVMVRHAAVGVVHFLGSVPPSAQAQEAAVSRVLRQVAWEQ